MPSKVKVLKSVAAKVIKPIATPIFAPPSIKSEEVLICFFVCHEKNIKTPIYNVPIKGDSSAYYSSFNSSDLSRENTYPPAAVNNTNNRVIKIPNQRVNGIPNR